jgi:hypothetical protein
MSGKVLLSNRLGCCSQTTSAWELQKSPKGEALRRISRKAAACCGEGREFAASQWHHFLEMSQFLYPIVDLPLF